VACSGRREKRNITCSCDQLHCAGVLCSAQSGTAVLLSPSSLVPRIYRLSIIVVLSAREMHCFLPGLPLYRLRFLASRWDFAPTQGAGLSLGTETVRCIQQKMTKTCTSCSTWQTPGSCFAASRATDVGVMIAVLVSY
jgi:hypothetical protein